ncbi:D-alanyl-D-alanine carboxypeptidase [Streptomyces sp. TRM68367]|uniref:D-alanyl-D-alanine carboxypeptidase n=1 Tax=Streptomyces sp. TRM68367 TaxID=2758415 RepID=UPI002934F6A8|nr:D-alanyl-D-alanine carboxypeptidase [Streptomyces sp. TRM68367]
MAGESPDRSKQRESSAQPTSGSAGPVPEARNEPRDPRLAVSRDKPDSATTVLTAPDPARGAGEADETADGASEARDGAEAGETTGGGRETRGVRKSRKTAEGTSETPDSDKAGKTAGGASEAPGGEKAEQADETAGGAGEAGESAGKAGERTKEASGAAEGAERRESGERGRSRARGASGNARSGSADTDADAGTEDADAGAGTRDTDAGAETGDADARGSASASGSSEAKRSGSPGAKGSASGSWQASSTTASDGRLRDAVAAWVASADAKDKAEDADADVSGADADAGSPAGGAGADAAGVGTDAGANAGTGRAVRTAAADTDAREDSDEDVKAGSDADEPSRATGADAKASAAGADGGKESQGAPEAAGDAEEGDEGRESGANADDSDSDTDEASEPEGNTGTASKAEAGPGAETDREPRPSGDSASPKPAPSAPDRPSRAQPNASEAPEARPGADPASRRGSGADTDPKPESGTDTGADPRGKVGKDTDPQGDAGANPGKKDSDSPERPVDQPTAVFKAVRPDKPAVDQPTTMLKVGDAAKRAEADSPDEAEQGGKGAGEKDAERTSKFVALKPLEDPASRKPRPAVDGDSALPKVPATAAVPQVGPERTTQQPLPPKPPLDLLAELTNTPPPPQTPLRTAIRRVKIWTPLVLLLVIIFAVVQMFRPLPAPTLQLTAADSYTFEGGKADIPWPSAGQAALDVQGIGTFGSSGQQKPVPIASVAKVMTAYLVLRDHPLKSGAKGPNIKIDQAAQDQSDAGQESTVDVTAGDSISQREALESILIASANNVARLLARWDAGSEKAFVAKMNAAAKDLGMTNTTYTDPSGLNSTTVSTAVDQVKLAKEAMKQPAFREIAAMMNYVDYKNVKHNNWNQLVGYNGVVGIKTGTTTSALGNLVFAAKKDVDGEPRTIIGAVVRQPEGGSDHTILQGALSASDRLIRAAQDALESATILKKGTVVGYVDDGLGGRTPVAVTEDVKAAGWSGLKVKLSFAADDVPHTAKAGTRVGTLTVGDGGTSGAVQVPVVLQQDLTDPAWTAKVTRLG